MSAKKNYKHGEKVSTHEVGDLLEEPLPNLLPDSEKFLLAGAMLQPLWHQTSSVMPLAAAGCFALSTKSVEAVSSSLPFPSQAFSSKSPFRDCDECDKGSRN